MKQHMLALCVVIFSVANAMGNKGASCPNGVRLAIGGYTYQPWSDIYKGEGVSILTLNATALTLEKLLSNATTDGVNPGENPSYCATSPTSLFCVNEVGDGTVTAMNGAVGNVSQATNSSGGNHLAVLPAPSLDNETRVIVANWGSSVSSLLFSRSNIGESRLADIYEIPAYLATAANMSDADKHNQEAPHAHMVLPLGNGDVLVPDLGSDMIWRFAVGGRGELWLKESLKMRPRDGPRHMVQGMGNNVYVVNELSNTVARIHGCDGAAVDGLRECDRTALLSGTSKLVNGDSAAAIRVSRDLKYLYASVRRTEDKHGLIVAFQLASDGSIAKKIGVFPSGGVHPRDFNIIENAPDCNSYIAVANTESNNIALLKRDKVSGLLTPTTLALDVKSPTSVLLLSTY